MKWASNLLIATSLLGFIALGLIVAEIEPPWVSRGRPAAVSVGQIAARVAPPPSAPGAPTIAAAATPAPGAPTATAASMALAPPIELPVEPRLPIERVVIPSISLDADVVPAALISTDGVLTWDIPKYKAGHADGTAGAGALGNAVLLGHVDSIRSGDVFRALAQVQVGDRITVHSGAKAFTYEVVETRTVDRTDTSMVQTTDTSSLTLFNCVGQWLPTIWDYTHRFVVRGQLREITA